MKDFICKKCGNTTYIMQEKLNGTGKAIGLYCAKCGTWHKWLNKQEKVLYSTHSAEIDYVADSKAVQTITDLLIEFDEMGFAPTTVCPDGEQYAIDWREKVRKEFARLTAKNAALQKRLDNAVELSYSYLEMLKLLACASKCYANLNCNSTRGFDEIKNAIDAFKDCLAKAEARLAEQKGGKQ